MPYPNHEPKTAIVCTLNTKDIQTLRQWARLEILAEPAELAVKEFLFELYKQLGEKI